MEPKKMDIKEFRTFGYLQEANRLFFHPLGLALEISINDDGSEYLSGIWDYRDDPEGMLYDKSTIQDPNAYRKAFRVEQFRLSKLLERIDLEECDDNGIQIIPES